MKIFNRYSVLFSLLCLSIPTFSQTSVSANITQNATWAIAGSPYLIANSTISVSAGKVLSIEPGVVVKFLGTNSKLAVDGQLLAQGTAGNPVIFTSYKDDTAGGDSNNDGSATTPAKEDWLNLDLQSPAGMPSQLSYCEFRYGGGFAGSNEGRALELNGAAGVSNCIFFQNHVGLYIDQAGQATVSNSQFTQNHIPFSIGMGVVPVMSGNTFSNNDYNAVGLEQGSFGVNWNYTLPKITVDGLGTVPYVFYKEELNLYNGGHLTIGPGVIIKFAYTTGGNSSYIQVEDAILTVNGSASEPVIFTSIKDDTAGGDTNNDGTATQPVAGDWKRLDLRSSTFPVSSLNYCEFRYGGTPNPGDTQDAGLRITNASVVNNCRFYRNHRGVSLATGSQAAFTNCSFEQNMEAPVSMMLGANPTFTGCTFQDNQYTGICLEQHDLNQGSYTGTYTLKKIAIQDLGYVPYIVFKTSVFVGPTGNLTIEPGVIVKSEGNTSYSSSFKVTGLITANGTAAEPVIFTSLRDDSIGGDTNGDGTATVPAQKDWMCISVQTGASPACQFQHCEFRYAGESYSYSGYSENGALHLFVNAAVQDCRFYRNFRGLVFGGASQAAVSQCVLEENTGAAMVMQLTANPSLTNLSLLRNQFHGMGLVQAGTYAGAYTLPKRFLNGQLFPYILEPNEGITLAAAGSLTVAPGAVFKLAPSTLGMTLSGKLTALGTPAEPIIFTSVRDNGIAGKSDLTGITPAPGDWPDVVLLSSSSSASNLRNCIFRYGGATSGAAERSALLVESSNPTLRQCRFEFNYNGIATKTIGTWTLDSCEFVSNSHAAIHHRSGTLTVRNCLLSKNPVYEIENLATTNLDAMQNLWRFDRYVPIQLNPAGFNHSFIYDKKDNGTYGTVDVSNPIPLPPGIWGANPETALSGQAPAAVTILGTPWQGGEQVILRKPGADPLVATNVQQASVYELNATIDFTEAEPGVYDVLVVQGPGDTLSLPSGFQLLDAPAIPFGQWVKFDVTKGHAYASRVAVPAGLEHLSVFVKKSTRLGYANTWQGNLTLYHGDQTWAEDDQFLGNVGGASSSDISLQLPVPEGGDYLFEIKTTLEQGEGYVLFTENPDTLELGNWTGGQVLRPHGYDWKILDLPSGVDTLYLRTEGIGVWSTLEVFRDSLSPDAERWRFDNPAYGYNLNGKIAAPPAGRYYLRYKDSAVLQGPSVPLSEQTREYLIQARTTPIAPGPRDLTISSLSTQKTGIGKVEIAIKGAGFSATDTAILSGPNGLTYQTTPFGVNDARSTCSIQLDFSLADTGAWELVLHNTLGQSAAAPEPIQVMETAYPEIWSRMNTREVLRIGRDNLITVDYGNRGDADAENVWLLLIIPENVLKEIRLPKGFTYPTDTLLPGPFQYVFIPKIPAHSSGQFEMVVNLPVAAEYGFGSYIIYDFQFKNAWTPEYADVWRKQSDLFYGNYDLLNPLAQPLPGEQVYKSFSPANSGEAIPDDPLWPAHTGLYVEEGGQGYVIDFDARQNGRVNKTLFTNWKDSTYYGCLHPGAWTDTVGQQIASAALTFYNSLGPVNTPTGGYATGWKIYFPFPFNDSTANCYSLVDSIYQAANFQGAAAERPASGASKPPAARKPTHVPPAKASEWDKFNCDKAFKVTKECGFKQDLTEGVTNQGANGQKPTEPVNIVADDCDALMKLIGERICSGIGSSTPEDKFGHTGYDAVGEPLATRHRFIPGADRFTYRIDYWNKPTATAPAVEVFIRDTLDADFDLTTFSFTEIGFLRWRIPLEGGPYFNVLIDLRPDFNLLLNVEGTMNPYTREVYWVHRSLDPATLDLPDDPFLGYLPPIDTLGYNIGWVNFSVGPLADLPTGTEFTNQARVNFDGIGPWGPAPPYGPFRNTYDKAAPVSTVQPIQAMSPSQFLVSWGGDDAGGCGIATYSVWVSTDGGPFGIWLNDTTATAALFSGLDGSTYSFYCIATDHLGNVETKAPLVEASTLVTSSGSPVAPGSIFLGAFPNPFNNETRFAFDLPENTAVRLDLIHPSGVSQTLFAGQMPAGRQVFKWQPAAGLPTGLYYLRIQAGEFVQTVKLIRQE